MYRELERYSILPQILHCHPYWGRIHLSQLHQGGALSSTLPFCHCHLSSDQSNKNSIMYCNEATQFHEQSTATQPGTASIQHSLIGDRLPPASPVSVAAFSHLDRKVLGVSKPTLPHCFGDGAVIQLFPRPSLLVLLSLSLILLHHYNNVCHISRQFSCHYLWLISGATLVSRRWRCQPVMLPALFLVSFFHCITGHNGGPLVYRWLEDSF